MDFLKLAETIESLCAKTRAMFKERRKLRSLEGLSEKATTVIISALDSGYHLFVWNDAIFVGNKPYFECPANPFVEELKSYKLIESVGGPEYVPTRRAWRSREKLQAIGDAYVLPLIPNAALALLSESDIRQGDCIAIRRADGFEVSVIGADGMERWRRSFKEIRYIIHRFSDDKIVVDWRLGGKSYDAERVKIINYDRNLNDNTLEGTFTARAERISRRMRNG